VAALVAAGIIAYNAMRIVRPAVDELMDRAPEASMLDTAARAAQAVPGVRAIEKLRGRKHGARYFMEIHVQADPAMSLQEAHVLSGMVKSAMKQAIPAVENVLVHMEPFSP
jgi:cation diffusion facilitator family transporter